MTTSAAPAVNLSDHAAAAAYLMNHASATALAVVDGEWPGQAGIITSADLFWAVAAGQDLDDIRIRDLMAKPSDRRPEGGRG